jgi:hypothetical protein
MTIANIDHKLGMSYSEVCRELNRSRSYWGSIEEVRVFIAVLKSHDFIGVMEYDRHDEDER